MRRLVLVLVLALVAFSALSACSSEETTGPTSSTKIRDGASDAGASSTSTTPASDAGTTPTTTTTTDDDDDATAIEAPEEHEGEATYYAAGTTGACGIKTPADKLVGSLGPALYSKANCGRCAEVTGPKGSVVVLLNDRCAGCKGASLDLATPAFTQIATKAQGRVKVTWHFVDCP